MTGLADDVPELTAADFAAFFRAVRGESPAASAHPAPPRTDPFPWQQRLVDELLDPERRDGCWPDLLDLPTGAGKTAAITIAVFVMACRADAPRRVVFVVDRRVVVAQAAQEARQIAKRLAAAQGPHEPDPVLRTVARRLLARQRTPQRFLHQSEEIPLQVAELRGGMTADRLWARRPDLPTVIVSTVDQVGSRLLGQGYGVSSSMQPVHAGLLANDCLILLDEVHLSRPFADTLSAIARYRRWAWDWGGADRWQVTHLSATPSGPALPDVFTLSDADRTGYLAKRLSTSKPAVVKTIPSRQDPQRAIQEMATALTEQALRLRKTNPHSVIAVIANRVTTATRVAGGLKAAGQDVVLLTGRMRPFDRDTVLYGRAAAQELATGSVEHPTVSEGALPSIRAGRDRNTSRPLFVVGTQAVEAGADFDFDVLVTEAAPVDALIQRFGRVNRLGAGDRLESVVVAPQPGTKPNPDPVYGQALSHTARWLVDVGSVDFGPEHLPLTTQERADLSTTPRAGAPRLFAHQLDSWWQAPLPARAPEPSLWLHGPESGDPDVTVVWRAGLKELDPQSRLDLLTAMPPAAGEGLEVPLSHVIRWLKQQTGDPDLSDMEAAGSVTSEQSNDWRSFTRIRGGKVLERSGRDQLLLPGDVVVVDSGEGGLDPLLTWNPRSTEIVEDLSVAASARRRVRFSRLRAAAQGAPRPGFDGQELADEESTAAMPETWAAWLNQMPAPAALAEDEPLDEAVTSWYQRIPEDLREAAIRGPRTDLHDLCSLGDLRRELDSKRGSCSLVVIPGFPGDLVLTGSLKRPGTVEPAPRQVALATHADDAVVWATGFVDSCGLPAGEAAAIVNAARYHDIGKSDPRFQRWISEGALTGDLLAKSAIPRSDRERDRAARSAAGYPRGERHEFSSAAMLHGLGPVDPLTGHLIAAHHGHARPFGDLTRPSCGPSEETMATIAGTEYVLGPHTFGRVDSPAAMWFDEVLARYGWYAQAWFTALLRLADHEASRCRQMLGPGQ